MTRRDIDELYQLPPEEFTAARNALAKTLTGEAARDVKALKKPNAVAWAVNQLYWKARPAWDALMKAGHALRAAQIAALKGRKSDVRETTDKHRKTVADAVKRAQQIAAGANVNPNTDQLARMFDALSLMPEQPGDAGEAGRFSEVVQPSGFAALAGVKPAPPAPPTSRDIAKQKKEREEDKRRRQAEGRLEKATNALADARNKADSAKRALNRAEADLADAEREVEAAEADVRKRSEEA